MTMKITPRLLLISMLFLALPCRAGWLFDDPIEVQAEHVPHAVSKDEIKFTPSGSCSNFHMINVEMTLELTYSTGKRTLNASQKWWSRLAPAIFTLPDNLSGLQSYRLTGKFYGTPFIAQGDKYTGDPKRDWKYLKGFKNTFDLKWIVK